MTLTRYTLEHHAFDHFSSIKDTTWRHFSIETHSRSPKLVFLLTSSVSQRSEWEINDNNSGSFKDLEAEIKILTKNLEAFLSIV